MNSHSSFDQNNVVSLSANGRVLIPSVIRQSLNLSEGDRFVIQADEHDDIRLFCLRDRIASAEGLFKDFAPKTGSVADELIAERRIEATQESSSS